MWLTKTLTTTHYNPFDFEHENIAGVVAARVGDHTANAIEVHGAYRTNKVSFTH